MRYFLLLLFSLFTTISVSQTYRVVIDGRLPPGTSFPSPSWGDGTTTVRGGNVDFEFRNWDRGGALSANVQFMEEIPNRTFASLTLRTVYFPFAPNCTPAGPNFVIVPTNELIPSPTGGGGGGGLGYCSAFFSVDAIPENMILTGPSGLICAGATIDLANNDSYPIEARSWRYRIPAHNGFPQISGRINDFVDPGDTGSRPIITNLRRAATFSMVDLIGENVKNYIGATVEFYMGISGYDFSNSVSIVIDDCTPIAQAFPSDASCSDSTGSVDIGIARPLDTSEDEYILLVLNDLSDNFIIPLANDEINSFDASNRYSIPEDLAPGNYRITFQSWVDPESTGIHHPNGLGIPVDFEIRAPSAVVIDNVVLIDNPDCPGEFGQRRIEVSGGQDFRTGVYHFTKDGGVNWDIPVDPNAVDYTYNDLLPGNDYTFGVKLVFSPTEECASASSVNQAIPEITNPLEIADGSGVEQPPSSQAATNGIIFVSVTGGTSDFTFDLYSSANPNVILATRTQTTNSHRFENLGVGNYFVNVTDQNGCEVDNESTPFEMTAAALPSLGSPDITSPTCAGDSDGEIQINISGGTAPYSYQWLRNGALLSTNTTSIDLTFSNLDDGNYELIVASAGIDIDTNPLATVRSGIIVLNDPTPVTIDTFTPNSVSCVGATDGSIDLTVSGGISYEYTHELFPADADWVPLTGNSIENLSSGFYYLTIRNESGCQSVTITNTDILIREPNVIGVAVTSNPASTNGGFQGSISLTITEGTPFALPDNPYIIIWTKQTTGTPEAFTDIDPSTPYEIIDLEAATYRATITDANGCSPNPNPVEIIITEPGPLSIDSLTGTDTCNGSNTGTITASVQGTGDIIFEFQQPLGNTVYTITTANRTVTAPNLGAGSYALRIEEVVGGNSLTTPPSDYFTITGLAPVNAIVTSTDATCAAPNSGSITISGVTGGSSSGYTYTIDNGVPQAVNTFSNLTAGAYLITVIDDLGCEYTETVTIEAGELPVLNELTTVVTNASSATSLDGSIVLEFETDPTNYTYAWSGPGVTGIITKDLNTIAAGTYQVIVSAPGNCRLIRNFTVGVQAVFSIQSFTGTPTCFNQANGSLTATIEATGLVTFNWILDDGSANGTLVASEATNLRTLSTTGLPAGTYYLEIVDTNNVIVRSTNNVEIIELAEVSALVTPVPTCLGETTGSITFSAPTGSPSNNYTYSIDNGATFQASPIFENLAAAAYTPRVSAFENPNCDYIAPGVIITNSPVLFWDLPNSTITRASGPGANDGAISAAFTGGTAPFTYVWAPNPTNSTTQNLTGVGAGTYSLTITDAANCSISENFEVTEIGPLTISNINPTDATCRGEANGSITTTVTGEGTITLNWTLANGDPVPVSNGVNEQNLTGILAGSYILTATDDNATQSTAAITIGEPATTLTITNSTTTDVSCFGGNSGSLEIQAAGGTGPYTYSLNGGNFQPSPIFNNLLANSYAVRVQDANGCEFLEPTPILIIEPEQLNLIINEQRPVTAANATDGAIFITVEGGSDDYTYEWTGPNGYTSTEEDPLNLAAGDYNVTITDANFALTNGAGCRLVPAQPITITEPGELLANATQTVLLSCFGDDFAEITANVQGGVAPYTYQWFQVVNSNNTLLAEDTEIIGNLTVGTYFVRATDANLVVDDSNQVIVNAPTLLQVTIDNTTNVLCAGQPTGAITITVSGGTPPYQYFWSNSATIADINGLDAGVYTVDVEDAEGCLAAATATITAPDDAIQIANATINDVSAYQAVDGSISLDISGGESPYTYIWTRLSDNSNAGNQATISNLAADSYTVSISDTNGCTVTETYEVTQPDIIEATIIQPSCSGDSDGSISVVVNQGNGAFAYLWNTGSTENNINNLPAGSYIVTITGLADGPVTRTYVLENPVPLEVNLGVDRILCADQILELDATVDDETATYLWTSDNGFSSSNATVVLSETGNYTVTVRSETGCTTQGTIFVDVSTDEINAEFAMSSQVFVGETAVAVDISYPLPDGIEWIVPIGANVITQDQDAAEFSFAEAGEYDITIITTRGGCIAQKTKKILVVAMDGLIQEDDDKSGQKLVEEFIIYPNPTTGRFTADVNLTEPGDISIKVFNFANNAMMASERGRGDTSYSIPFDISGMPSGVYAVLLETPYGTSLRKVVVR